MCLLIAVTPTSTWRVTWAEEEEVLQVFLTPPSAVSRSCRWPRPLLSFPRWVCCSIQSTWHWGLNQWPVWNRFAFAASHSQERVDWQLSLISFDVCKWISWICIMFRVQVTWRRCAALKLRWKTPALKSADVKCVGRSWERTELVRPNTRLQFELTLPDIYRWNWNWNGNGIAAGCHDLFAK